MPDPHELLLHADFASQTLYLEFAEMSSRNKWTCLIVSHISLSSSMTLRNILNHPLLCQHCGTITISIISLITTVILNDILSSSAWAWAALNAFEATFCHHDLLVLLVFTKKQDIWKFIVQLIFDKECNTMFLHDL